MWTSVWKPSGLPGEDDYIPAAIALVALTAVAMAPLLPWHTLALGLSVEGMYILSCWLATRWEFTPGPVHGNAHHIFLTLLAMLATGISAANYERSRSEFAAAQEAVRAAEALTGAQLRAQLAENAISIGKMAAALTHEINSPLGTLRSSVGTLLAITGREAEYPPEKLAQIDEMRAALSRSIEESATRIDLVTHRLRRFVNLEEAEMKSADLNDLLTDVTLLHQEELEGAHIHLDFDLEQSLPPLTCRPQLLSAAFSSLLSNAIHAVNGDGRIAIATRLRDLEVEVAIRDNGRGMPPEEVETIFDPSFKVAGSRVASGNWSLFNSRQIVYEHGGEIRVESAEGKGTEVFVTLPLVG
jgi:two-component system NtrC family sensor kinase